MDTSEREKTDHLDRLIAYTGSPDVYDAPSVEELRKTVAEIHSYREVKAALRDALREAYDAGVTQGQEKSTAYEWGSSSTYTDEQAFKEALEPYNGGAITNVLAIIGAAQ